MRQAAKKASGVPVASTVHHNSRAMYPIHEARERLGGISHSNFYERVKKGEIRLIKLGRRSFVSASEISRIAGAN